MTTKQDLIKTKSRALRMRVWFKTLSRAERAIIDLTIKCVVKVQSKTLARIISTIVNKLLEFFEEGFMERAERIGHKIAEKLWILCERWGGKECSTWKHDECFVRFLGINSLNTQCIA